MLQRSLLAISTLLAVVGSAVSAFAAPADVFSPHLDKISQNLPQGWVMRLPSQILLGGPADEDFINELIVKVFPSQAPPGMTVSLFSCEVNPHPCLVGSFSVDRKDSANTQREFKKHQAAAAPIRLTDNVRGYFLDGSAQKPASIFSSVMWEQDGMLYTVSFLSGERQNILNMAYMMANSSPIRRTVVREASAR